MAINVDGLISGIDTQTIIDGLLEVQQKQLDTFSLRRQTIEAKRSAFNALQAQLLSVRTSAGQLARSQGNPLDSRTVSVSSPDNLIATASSGAAPGVYQITVESLAKAHQVATQGFSDADAAITTGTFDIRVGNQAGTTLTIDSTNNTLQGLADSINFANIGVSATIINDGSSGGAAYRLLLTSSKTGEAGEISVTNNLAASSGGAVQPVLDFGNPIQAATNAVVKLGSGVGALTVQSETNQINNLIPGVSLTLLAEDAGKAISVSIATDTEKSTTAVQEFVDAYNGALDFIENLTKYNVETDTAGLLIGDRSIGQIRNELLSLAQGVVPGANVKANRLSSVGVTVNERGRLVLNATKLQDVINGKVAGVTSQDVKRLFALDGAGTTGNIQFLLGSAKTKDSTTPYEVNVTQAAERAALTAGTALAASTVIDGTNKALSLRLDGEDFSVVLTEGTYTRAELAEQLQSAINSHPDLAGRSVAAGVNATNQLTLHSSSYGNTSALVIVSGTSLGALGFIGGESDTGQDVAGEFIVNGVVEAATGRGRILVGNADNANTADLQVRVTLSAAQIVAGVEGSITVSRGITSKLDQAIGKLLDADTGLLENVNDQYNDQLDALQRALDRQQAVFDKQKESLVEQFAALETALASLQSTSSLLGTQLAGISGLGGR